MKVFHALSLLGGILVAVPVSAAQHNIVISDSLAANADTLIVKRGAQTRGQVEKLRIGDYQVASGTLGPTTTRKNDAKSSSSGTFSFVLTNTTKDSARVNGAHHITLQLRHDVGLGHGSDIGKHDEALLDSENDTASITLNGDTTDTWTLLVGIRMVERNAGKYQAVLTNGERRIVLSPARSRTHGLFGVLGSAAGYEFFENGQSLCALQYFGGTFGNSTLAWMLPSLDAQTKLLLAAAMTAVLQMKSMDAGP